MHIADLDKGMMGANGIVGGGPPLSAARRWPPRRCRPAAWRRASFGDGGSNQGTTFEAMNLAAVWKLPAIFIFEKLCLVIDRIAGWMLTENGRQPWIVQGLMKTTQGVSPSVSTTEIWISLITFVLIYVVLGVADLVLMMRYARRGLPDEQAVSTSGEGELPGGALPEMAY